MNTVQTDIQAEGASAPDAMPEQVKLLLSIANFSDGVYRAASVQEQPSVRIYNWMIMHMNEGDFFCGTEYGGLGRASTKIVEFDPETKRGRTESGRIYELIGEPATEIGMDRNAAHVWAVYARVNKLTPKVK